MHTVAPLPPHYELGTPWITMQGHSFPNLVHQAIGWLTYMSTCQPPNGKVPYIRGLSGFSVPHTSVPSIETIQFASRFIVFLYRNFSFLFLPNKGTFDHETLQINYTCVTHCTTFLRFFLMKYKFVKFQISNELYHF